MDWWREYADFAANPQPEWRAGGPCFSSGLFRCGIYSVKILHPLPLLVEKLLTSVSYSRSVLWKPFSAKKLALFSVMTCAWWSLNLSSAGNASAHSADLSLFHTSLDHPCSLSVSPLFYCLMPSAATDSEWIQTQPCVNMSASWNVFKFWGFTKTLAYWRMVWSMLAERKRHHGSRGRIFNFLWCRETTSFVFWFTAFVYPNFISCTTKAALHSFPIHIFVRWIVCYSLEFFFFPT